MGKSTSIVVRLSPDTLARVAEMAAAGSTTKAALIAELVEKALISGPAVVDGEHYDRDVAQLRAEYERANAALRKLERQLSSLSIRMRASGVQIPEADPGSALRSDAEPGRADELVPPTGRLLPPPAPGTYTQLPPPAAFDSSTVAFACLDDGALEEILSNFED